MGIVWEFGTIWVQVTSVAVGTTFTTWVAAELLTTGTHL